MCIPACQAARGHRKCVYCYPSGICGRCYCMRLGEGNSRKKNWGADGGNMLSYDCHRRICIGMYGEHYTQPYPFKYPSDSHSSVHRNTVLRRLRNTWRNRIHIAGYDCLYSMDCVCYNNSN